MTVPLIPCRHLSEKCGGPPVRRPPLKSAMRRTLRRAQRVHRLSPLRDVLPLPGRPVREHDRVRVVEAREPSRLLERHAPSRQHHLHAAAVTLKMHLFRRYPGPQTQYPTTLTRFLPEEEGRSTTKSDSRSALKYLFIMSSLLEKCIFQCGFHFNSPYPDDRVRGLEKKPLII